jgi:hypothetical protein
MRADLHEAVRRDVPHTPTPTGARSCGTRPDRALDRAAAWCPIRVTTAYLRFLPLGQIRVAFDDVTRGFGACCIVFRANMTGT